MADIGTPFRVIFSNIFGGGGSSGPRQVGYGSFEAFRRARGVTPATTQQPVQLPPTVGGSSGPKRTARPKTKRQRRQELEALQRELDKFKTEVQREVEKQHAKRKTKPKAPRGRPDLGLTPGMDLLNEAAQAWAWDVQMRAIERRTKAVHTDGPAQRAGPRGKVSTEPVMGPRPTLTPSTASPVDLEELLHDLPTIDERNIGRDRGPGPAANAAGPAGSQRADSRTASPGQRPSAPRPTRNTPAARSRIASALDLLTLAVPRDRPRQGGNTSLKSLLAGATVAGPLGFGGIAGSPPSQVGTQSCTCKPKKKRSPKARTKCSVYQVTQRRFGTTRKFIRSINC